MNFEQIRPVVRHGLQFFGGYLASRGLLTDEMVIEMVGFGMGLASVLWWQLEKRNAGPSDR